VSEYQYQQPDENNYEESIMNRIIWNVVSGLCAVVIAGAWAAPAFGSMVDWTKHRDSLARTSATYK
jgi:hypothetical protein